MSVRVGLENLLAKVRTTVDSIMQYICKFGIEAASRNMDKSQETQL